MIKNNILKKLPLFLHAPAIMVGILFLSFSDARSNGIGTAPEISLGYKINDQWSLATKTESFHTFYSFDENLDNSWKYNYEGTDIQLFFNYRLNPFWRVALGYQLGTEPQNVPDHRSIQQLTYSRRPEGILFGHRLRTDQTFYADESPQYRIRYRLSVEFPLQGLAIDQREFFIVTSEELILATQNNEVELENRLALWLGYQLLNGNELQTGIDYRIDSAGDQKIWFKIAMNVRL